MGELLTAFCLFGSALGAWAYFLRDTRHPLLTWAGRCLRQALLRARLTHEAPPEPVGRPVEAIAADLRRLAIRYRCPQEGARFAKVEGYRRAYDGVLAEACCALGIATLLGVLPPGRELDTERVRVEESLDEAGISLGIWL